MGRRLRRLDRSSALKDRDACGKRITAALDLTLGSIPCSGQAGRRRPVGGVAQADVLF
jgi:hypothetical protein